MTSRTQERTPSAVGRAEGSKDRWDAESTDMVPQIATAFSGRVAAITDDFDPAEWCDECQANRQGTDGCGCPTPNTPRPTVPGFQGTTGVTTLSDVTPERVSWLWPGRLPVGKLVVIDGDPSTGKSTLALDLAAHVSTGNPWPDGQPGQVGGVLLLSAEDGLADTIAPRLAAAGADPTKIHALTETTVIDEDGKAYLTPPSLPRDIGLLRKIVLEHGIKLIVIDVLMAYLSTGVDSHRDQHVRTVLHELSAMAEETGCTIILIRHLNKTAGANALYRGGGSIGIVGAARAAFLVARDPEDDDRRIFAITKSNLQKEPPSLAYRLTDSPEHDCAHVVWEDGPVAYTAADLLSSSDPEEAAERDEAVEWLLDYLQQESRGGEAPAGEAIKAAAVVGISKTTLGRARRKAGVISAKAGLGPWVWTIAAEESTEDPEEPEESTFQTLGSSGSSADSSTAATCPTHGTPTWKGQCGRCEAGASAA